uniref:Uncharacterized protein n=1 Tax=Phocoena sinus TaxID=42100 RepID=A0A8C9CPV8_PHOSS
MAGAEASWDLSGSTDEKFLPTRWGLVTDTEKDTQPPKQQLMIHFNGECHTGNEKKSRNPIRYRNCGHRITYKKRTGLVGFDS